MKEETKIICGYDNFVAEFKYTVRNTDSMIIGLYSCPDCGCWYEIPMKEVAGEEVN